MTKKAINKEEKINYPLVREWLGKLLKSYYPKSDVNVFDTSKITLGRFLEREGYFKHFPEFKTFDFHIPITGIVITKKENHLVFIECKIKPITLRDISQLLGYSRVAKPLISLIISPTGTSHSIDYLLKVYNRYDILEYDTARRIKIATWIHDRQEIDYSNILPPGDSLQLKISNT